MRINLDTLDISVLMATWNRAPRLAQTLEYFSQLDTCGITWELIIVANGCTDATPDIVARFAQALPIVYVEEPVAGKSRAMNRGLDRARGDLLILTDDDIIPDSAWLQEWRRAAKRWPHEAIFGGRIDPLFPPEAPAWMTHPNFAFTRGAFARYAPASQEGPVDMAPFGPNQAVRARVLTNVRYCESIGPRGTAFAMGEDVNLMQRLHANRYQYIYIPTARVQHPVEPHQLTLTWLLQRAYRFGRGDMRARFHTYRKCPYWFGVPRFLWRQVVAYWLQHAMNQLSSTEKRFKTGYPLALVRGMIHEARIMAAEIPTDSLQSHTFHT